MRWDETPTNSIRPWSRTARCGAGCSGCSVRRWHSAITWSPIPTRGSYWQATLHCRRPTSCVRHSPNWPNGSKSPWTQWLLCLRCASSTATGCWCWPPSTWRRRWRTNPCCRSPRSVPSYPIWPTPRCGARELTYVSDVDVIFVADDADATATRLAGEMMRFAGDTFFEVDAALRPEGKRGQLVRTLDSHIAYYQRWAKTWEFQALMKARPAAGDAELGRQYIEALIPMVWTASEREDFVPEVQAMRRRVEELVPAGVRAREIKLGTGGLRDVEFAVQLLQLVHGRNDESLHVASTVDALAALGEGGYIGRDDTANMTASYEFLRLLEHRLQLQRLKRTHMLPEADDDEALRWLARAAHVRPDGRHDALGVLREELKRQSLRVSRLHAKLFYQPLLESVSVHVGLSGGMSAEAAERQIAALGYQAPQNALTHLAA